MPTAIYQPEAGRGDGITELQNRTAHTPRNGGTYVTLVGILSGVRGVQAGGAERESEVKYMRSSLPGDARRRGAHAVMSLVCMHSLP